MRIHTKLIPAAWLFVAIGLHPAFGQVTAQGFEGSSVSVYSNGTWSLHISNPGWTFGGSLGASALAPHSLSGKDALGAYQEVAFTYSLSGSSRAASIRLYTGKPAVIFSVTYNNDSTTTAQFPVISTYPSSLSHLTYNGEFAPPDFYDLMPDSPWVWFDSAANTFVLSPADNFMTVTTQRRNDVANTIETGISTKISVLPAGFTHRTLLSFGHGFNQTMENWGSALTTLGGKKRPANDSDALLKQVSYWTDNGATYYYNPGGASYTDTLASVKKEFDSKGIKLGALQLDSWWYPKGPDNSWSSHSGIWTYTASPALFQTELSGFQANIKTPLVTHARWIDAASPYRTQFAMSGNVSTDPAYWETVASYLKTSGAATYEQDWLGDNAHADFNLTDPDLFLGNMSAAMAKHGLTIQYCMATPAHFLQSSLYSNVSTIRTSQDRFRPENWTEFFYSSRLASTLGVWPFTDVLMTSELNNLIIATLSAGPIGVGDPMGALSAPNLLRAVRADGIIVKPDTAATPVDSVVLNDALKIDAPMLASTYTDAGAGLKTWYLFSYVRGANRSLTIDPASYGIKNGAWLYDVLHDSGRFIDANSTYTWNLQNDTGYFVLSPVQSSGIAFLGDHDNFVTAGKKRISKMLDDGQTDVTVSFASTEKTRTLFGFSAQPVQAVALNGTYGGLTWDPSTQMFTVNVHPASGTAHLRFRTQGVSIPIGTSHPGGCATACGNPVQSPIQDQ